MSSIKEKLANTLKSAMKSGDKTTVSFARNLHAAIRKKEIDDQLEIQDEEVQKVILARVKQHLDSIDAFQKGNRQDLVEKEQSELAFLRSFLPEPMPESELTALIRTTIAELEASSFKDIGRVLKALLPKTQGRADSKYVSDLVRNQLNSH